VYEIRVLRRIFGPKRDEVKKMRGENDKIMCLMICTPYHILLGRSNREKRERRNMQNVWGDQRCVQGFGGET
jgi:hypothetical protein